MKITTSTPFGFTVMTAKSPSLGSTKRLFFLLWMSQSAVSNPIPMATGVNFPQPFTRQLSVQKPLLQGTSKQTSLHYKLGFFHQKINASYFGKMCRNFEIILDSYIFKKILSIFVLESRLVVVFQIISIDYSE